MGLLDLVGNEQALLGLSLLSAAGPHQRRVGIGEGLLGALQGVQAQRQANEDRQQRAALQDMQMQHIQAQIGETQAQAAQRQAQAEAVQRQAVEQQRIQQLVRGAFSPVQPIQANQASGVAGPRPEALSAVGQRQPVDWQSLIAQGVPAELVAKLAEAPNLGLPEVARTIDGRDAQGRPVTLQFDKQGRQIGQVVQQWKAPVKVDLGGQLQMMDPTTLAVLAQLKKSNTPDALLSAQTAMRGQNMTDARAREKNQIDAGAVGKVEWKQDVNGNWIALPKEVTSGQPVVPITTTAPGKREQQAGNALSIIKEAEGLIDKATSSYAGAGIDQAARVFGAATPGSTAGAQLKALEGSLMMSQPRMEGPQSDKDVALYRQMAGRIGDSTVPAAEKKAALGVIRQLHQRYAGQQAPAASAGGVKFLGFE